MIFKLANIDLKVFKLWLMAYESLVAKIYIVSVSFSSSFNFYKRTRFSEAFVEK